MTVLALTLARKSIMRRLRKARQSEETAASKAFESSAPKRAFVDQNPHNLKGIDMIDRIGLI